MRTKIGCIESIGAILPRITASSATLAWHGAHGHGGWQRIAPQPG